MYNGLFNFFCMYVCIFCLIVCWVEFDRKCLFFMVFVKFCICWCFRELKRMLLNSLRMLFNICIYVGMINS